METLAKKPFQVHLRTGQLDSLRYLAERRDVSVAELIRQGIDCLLANVPWEEDPLMSLIGMGDGGPDDLVDNFDEYLVKAIEAENR
jgi:hypothetical protein